MDVIISTSNVIPTTAEQVRAFSAWATGKYDTFKEYSNLTQREEISVWIRSNIFTPEMKSIWRETEPYVGIDVTDLHMGRLLVYRKRLHGKIKYMRGKLGKLAFPAEAARIREHLRNLAARRLFFRQAPPAVILYYQPEPDLRIPKIVKPLSEEEATAPMEEECVICMSKHQMVESCVINCGHRFGAACLGKWNQKHASCPLCRTLCTEITVYTAVIVIE